MLSYWSAQGLGLDNKNIIKHKKKNMQHYKNKKKKTQLIICLLTLIVFFTGLFFGLWWQGIVFVVMVYVLTEIAGSDHLFYDVATDYDYDLQPDEAYDVLLDNIALPSNLSSCNTWLLSVNIKSKLTGHWFDPYVVIGCAGKQEKQYFERGGKGRRYINLSDFSDQIRNQKQISLTFKNCASQESEATIFGFNHPDYSSKRLLIIAPHADDAEIAAFGLYSSAKDVHIVTLTAGEVEMEDYCHVFDDPIKASRLKGRLRALDGNVVPLWGGVSPSNCINLGYFCKRLSDMYQNPDKSVRSLTADLNDTRLFRQYNPRKLQSDENGLPTWYNLIQDLAEIITDVKPEVIITPHPDIDPHLDHIYGTKALMQVLETTGYKSEHILYYANHFRTTDMFPFGPEHTVASLPPQMTTVSSIQRVYSFKLTKDQQKNKVFALEMMHDLKRKLEFKKMFREQLQYLAGRKPNRYGREGYFRKAIKNSEIFYCTADSRKDEVSC